MYGTIQNLTIKTKEKHRNLSQYTTYPSRHSKLALPEYKCQKHWAKYK